jgi:type IV pilus assembly protein PilQ
MTRHWLAALLAILLVVFSATTTAGDLTALNWEESADAPTLQVWVSGNPAYDVQSLDGGQRLRLSLPGTTLREVSDIEGRGAVKGVYPYLSETGTGVNIDFLLNQPGDLKVESASYGYRVVAAAAAGATAKPETKAAPKPEEKPKPATASVKEKPAALPEKVAAPTPPVPVVAAAPAAPPVAPPAPPAPPKSAINEILHAKLPGDRVQIQLRIAGGIPKPAVFTTTNPARIAFDFPNTRVGEARSSVKIDQGAVTSINAIEAQNRTRVVVNLVRAAGYTTSSDGRSFTITVDNPAAGVAGTQAPKTTRFATAARPGKHNLKKIDFRRGPHGDAKIVVGLSDTGVGIDIREQAGEIIVDFLDTGIPNELQRRLDVTDFGTPVHNVDTLVQGKNVRMVISAKGKYEHLAYQTGETFTVNVKPITEKPGEKKKDEFGYSGEKLSLNFQNIDVRAALQVIADFTNINFVTSDTVKGNLTLRLKDVPWDQALEIIADAKNLAIRKSGNVVRVGPADEVAAKEKSALEAQKVNLDMEPLASELVQINYAKAEDLAKLLKSIRAIDPGGGGGAPFSTVSLQKVETESNTLLSPRGNVTVDKRTNTLLIQDIPSKIREVRKLIAQLDQPVRQVLIETRLVEATDDFAKNIGVRWGGLKWLDYGRTNETQPIGCGTHGCIVDAFNGDDINLDDYLSVNLGAPSIRGVNPGAITLGLLRLSDTSMLTLELQALEAEGKGKVISSPRLITGNSKKARIEQGQEGLFTVPGGVGVTYVIRKAVLALEVTPQITPDDRVIMDVLITKDVFADSRSGLINKKEITTQVLLDNGETVVIGGIYEQTEGDRTYKVPLFGDIPVLGTLFRSRQQVSDKTELLIFLTPRIMSERLSLK